MLWHQIYRGRQSSAGNDHHASHFILAEAEPSCEKVPQQMRINNSERCFFIVKSMPLNKEAVLRFASRYIFSRIS